MGVPLCRHLLVTLSLCLALGVASAQQTPAYAKQCSVTVPFARSTYTYTTCAKLGSQFSLAWTYDIVTSRLSVWFRGRPEMAYGWAGWGISTTGSMYPANATVGFANPANPREVNAKAYFLKDDHPEDVIPNQGFAIQDIEVDYANNGELLHIRCNIANFSSGFQNVIWRGGPLVADFATGVLTTHRNEAPGFWVIDFSTGVILPPTPYVSTKTIHAWLAAIGFGVLLPFGVLVARHVKVFVDPLWFYIHIGMQATGYIIGVVGWGYGIWLRTKTASYWSSSSTQSTHFAIGVTIFCTATLQLITPVLRPHKDDPIRLYWNIVHWVLGYTTLIMSVAQIFLGFNILGEQRINFGGWRTAYIAFLCIWAVVFLLMEPLSWYLYFQNKKYEEEMAEAEDGEEGEEGEEGDEEEGQYEEEEEEQEEEEEEEGSYDDEKPRNKYRDYDD